jgi:large subunit ribosomal protein LP0
MLALGVPTKIARGTIEIVNEVHLVHKAAKVGASEATLLNMLNISPFTYGMVVQQVYDSGNVFAPSILDVEEKELLSYFTAAIRNVTSVSLAAGYPTIVSVSHSLVNSYKNLLAVSVETDYDFEGSEKVSLSRTTLSKDDSYCVLSYISNEEEKVTLIFY